MLTRADMRPYQETGAQFIQERKNCAEWIFMGGGKGVTTATAYARLKEQLDASKMLVIAPKRVARTVWSSEVEQWSHLNHLRVSRIIGDADQCLAALKVDADIYTLGRDRVPWLHSQFIRDGRLEYKWPWDMVVLDEAQSFKSVSSQRFKALADLRIKTRFPRMVQLTGTPMPNGYEGVYSQMWLLDRGKRLGNTFTAFRDRWFTPPVGIFSKWVLKPHAPKEIQAQLKDIVYCLQEADYMSLPPVVDNFIRCELSTAALATYKKFEREFIAEVAGKKLTAVNAGVLDGKLLQLSNGAVYFKDRDWVSFHDSKLEALDETLEGLNGKKALIAYAFKHDLARIGKVLAAQDEPWCVLQSDASFEKWAAGEYTYGVLHPASAGHGINAIAKTDVSDIIHFGMTANLELFQQVNARLTGGHRREGRNVTIHYLVCEQTRDMDYVALIKKKALDQDGLMSALAAKVLA